MLTRSNTTVLLGRFEDIFLSGLKSLLQSDGHIDLVAAGVNSNQLTSALGIHRPTVAMLNLSDLHSPLQIRELALEHPATRFLAVADDLSPVEANQLMAFGAAGCIARTTQARDVLHVVHLASRGLKISPSASEQEPPRTEFQSLTPREADVLALLQTGKSNSEIALQLSVGIETVRTHARNIYRKLGVQSRRQLKTPVSTAR